MSFGIAGLQSCNFDRDLMGTTKSMTSSWKTFTEQVK